LNRLLLLALFLSNGCQLLQGYSDYRAAASTSDMSHNTTVDIASSTVSADPNAIVNDGDSAG